MLRFLILIDYFELMMHLQVSGKMTQYINVHYQYLVYISMFISLVLALVQLRHWVSQAKNPSDSLSVNGEMLATKANSDKTPTNAHSQISASSLHAEQHTCVHASHHSHSKNSWQNFLGYLLLLFPLIVGLFFPSVSLDATIVDAKGFQFPLSKEASGDSFMNSQYLRPDTSVFFNKQDYDQRMKQELAEFAEQQTIQLTEEKYLQIMELIYNFPSQFSGKTIQFSGFVYCDPVDKKKNLFLFRFGIIHCIADSGVYGLLVHLPEDEKLPENNTWLTVTGKVSTEYYTPFKRHIPAVTAEEIQPIAAPKNQYVYRQFE